MSLHFYPVEIWLILYAMAALNKINDLLLGCHGNGLDQNNDADKYALICW